MTPWVASVYTLYIAMTLRVWLLCRVEYMYSYRCVAIILKAGSQYTQTRRSVGGVLRFLSRMDLSSIPATALRPCRVNVCVYCEPALIKSYKSPLFLLHSTIRCMTMHMYLASNHDTPSPLPLSRSCGDRSVSSSLHWCRN